MTDDDIRRSLAERHPASAGCALSCCRWNREEAEEVLQVAYLKVLDRLESEEIRGMIGNLIGEAPIATPVAV